MPLIVDPAAPPVDVPDRIVSPDGWLAAVVDGLWAGVVLAVDYTAASPLPAAADVRRVRIVRQDPGADPVPVRSADTAWALGGVGTAYDHEMPLGVPLVYTATPQYADGTWGPASSLAVTVPAPAAGEPADLWIKSIDEPGLSARAMILERGEVTSTGRLTTAQASGSLYRSVAWDTAAAPSATVTIDVPPDQSGRVRELLRSGVLLAQVRPAYRIPDAYFVPGDISERHTGRLGNSGGWQFTFTIEPTTRPATTGAPLRMPGWSYDEVAGEFGTYDAVDSSYSSYAALSTDGVT